MVVLAAVLVSGLAAAPTRSQSSVCDLIPLAVQDPAAGPFEIGCTEYQIKYGGAAASQGTYGALDFPACSLEACEGSTRYRCELVNDYPCCLDDGVCVLAKSGNMSGPTEQALAARFNNDTDQREGICFSLYTGNGARTVSAPATGRLQGSGSAACYAVLHYGTFFLTRMPGSGGQSILWANYLGPTPPIPVPARRSAWGSLKLRYR
jgi:hypothetical protein